MECPRCGADMETYSLGGREAQACESCNYVGVPVEHQSEREKPETWADALSRFEERFAGSVGETSVTADADDLAALVGEGTGDGAADERDAAAGPEGDASEDGSDDGTVETGDAPEGDTGEAGSDDDGEAADLDENDGEAADPDEDATTDDGEGSSADAGEEGDEPDEKPDDEPEVAADGAPDPAATSDSGATTSGPNRTEKRRKRR